MPIIFIGTSDPVREGFAVSLARPGGNMTGMTTGNDQIAQKLLELLILVVPKLSRIAVVTNPANTGHTPRLMQVQAAAKQLGKQVFPISARTADEIERSFATMARKRIGAVIILADVLFSTQHAQIAAFALKHRLPSIYPRAEYAEAGGLMTYGTDLNDNYRRAGIFVDKILKGAKPGDIPFEQPTRYYLEINRKTANALGIKLNNEMLTRADKVIE
jgi:putative ABC transport system substrate-binding protein